MGKLSRHKGVAEKRSKSSSNTGSRCSRTEDTNVFTRSNHHETCCIDHKVILFTAAMFLMCWPIHSVHFSLGLSTGNLAKKRHLEIPSNHNAATSTKKINVTSSHVYKSNIKRNLLSQLENTDNGFAKPKSALKAPIGKVIHTSKQCCIESNWIHFPYFQSLANLSAGKIVKKYRRSSRHRFSYISGTDESLLNYDVFEVIDLKSECLYKPAKLLNLSLQSKMKTSVTNSSVVDQQENIRDYGTIKMNSMLRPAFKTPTKTNTTRTKSPLVPSNFTRLQTKNVADFV